jgi:hypothetical protein
MDLKCKLAVEDESWLQHADCILNWTIATRVQMKDTACATVGKQSQSALHRFNNNHDNNKQRMQNERGAPSIVTATSTVDVE